MSTAFAEISQGPLGQLVQLAILHIALDSFIKSRSIELLEPGTKLGELIRWKLCNSIFDVVDAHDLKIAIAGEL